MDAGGSIPKSSGFRYASYPGCLRHAMPTTWRTSLASTTGNVTTARSGCLLGLSERLDKSVVSLPAVIHPAPAARGTDV